MCYSIPSTEILLILRYQHITTQIKQNLTHKYGLPQTSNCKGGHMKMTTVIKISFTFAVQLANPVIKEIIGGQGSLTQQPYELL